MAEIFLPELHSEQLRVWTEGSEHRYNAIRCGRRWGKTVMLVDIAISYVTNKFVIPGTKRSIAGRVGIFTAQYRQYQEIFDELVEYLKPLIKTQSRSEKRILLKNGGKIDFWVTDDNKLAGRGRKYHCVLIDEAAFTKSPEMLEEIWPRAIKPTLVDYRGRAWVFSTPDGINDQNFFYAICNDPAHGFHEHHAPSSSNPHLPADELAEIERTTDPRVWQQEFLAKFIDWSKEALLDVNKLLVDGLPVEMPTTCDMIFAVTDQNPNSRFFQKPNNTLKISGKSWHPSRTLKIFHGTPIYLKFQNSTFGFTGRSVFQRVLYPMKSYIGTMEANDLVSQKAGVLVAKTVQNGSIMNGIKQMASSAKRAMVKIARTGGVISIGDKDSIESLNLQNIDGALNAARDNIISDIASGSDVPAILIKEEAFSKGWSDGSEDSKAISQYIDGVRQQIEPVMDYFEKLVQYIAWNEDFFTALKGDYPDIITEDYKTTFYQWRREFTATWQELVEESPDKRRESDSKVIQQATALYTGMSPTLDPENRAVLAEWLAAIVSGTQTYGDMPLIINVDSLANYTPPTPPERQDEVSQPGGEKEEAAEPV